jgi:NAD(P)-dependent dehydrogenase (short-subunit alcohol dehydrogenase family)
VARRLAEEGAKVVVGDIRADEGKSLADALAPNAVFAELDVTSEESWKDAIRLTITTFGSLDVLINNAGVFLGMQAAAAHMVEGAAVRSSTSRRSIRYKVGRNSSPVALRRARPMA